MTLKTTNKENRIIREFINKYLDKQYKIDWNVIKLSKADGIKHNQMVATVCCWLLHNNIPFATQCRFTSNYRPDIICPTGLPVRIIEVRNTETDKRTKEKEVRIPTELLTEIAFVDANLEFKEKMIL